MIEGATGHTSGGCVSVVVATYNSARFVVETLESVKNQTYSDIELIVSDDGSYDETVTAARAWIKANEGRFLRTEVLTVPANTGVSANCNRGLAAARSEWVKFIAGDDILLPNCLADNILYVVGNPGIRVLFSQVRMYEGDFKECNFRYTYPQSVPMNIMNPAFTPADQHRILLESDCISYTPSYFFHRPTLLSLGGYDEANRMVEDYPMWLKLTAAGIRLHFMLKETVGYRQHDAATNNRGDHPLIQPAVFRVYAFRRNVVHPQMPWIFVMNERYVMQIALFFQSLGWNKKTRVIVWIYQLLTVYLNPWRYAIYLSKEMHAARK